ncbi:hypothetical protein OPT61_g9465 [Boeremia exigua]|uniref:Uncharacterized protein n=1 Tax=Boeremia exigua TaxID=749465 RepID=A0ACC2HUA5_9PLEO|nr:hypothetical protein OPT61_g9465 [Boeremia exigua]
MASIKIHSNSQLSLGQRQIIQRTHLGVTMRSDEEIVQIDLFQSKSFKLIHLSTPSPVPTVSILSYRFADVVMFLGWVLLLALFVLLYFLPPYVVLQAALRPLLDRGLAGANLSHMLGIVELVIYTCLLSAHTLDLEYALWLFFGRPDQVEAHNMDVRTSSILRAMFEVLMRTPLRILRLESRAHLQSNQVSGNSAKELTSDASLATSRVTTDAIVPSWRPGESTEAALISLFILFERSPMLRGTESCGRSRQADCRDFSHLMVNDYLQRLSGDEEKESLKQSLLYRLVESKDEQTGNSLSQVELEEHAIIFLTVGSETTTAALMWFLWKLGQLPHIRERLAREIRTAFPDPAVSPTHAEISKLSKPYLKHTIDKSLRLWAPLSVNNPRVSPGKVIGGHFIPAGTIVSNSIYSTSRDPTVFPNPGIFDPSRWENATSTMRIMSRPFSSGPRNCIGKHLAEINLALTIARLYQLYDIVPDPSMTEEVMRVKDQGVLSPWEDQELNIQ